MASQPGFHIEIVDDGERHGCRPPALLVDDRLVAPSDGVIVAPEDLAAALPDAGAGLLALLEAAQETMMEAWSAQSGGT